MKQDLNPTFALCREQFSQTQISAALLSSILFVSHSHHHRHHHS